MQPARTPSGPDTVNRRELLVATAAGAAFTATGTVAQAQAAAGAAPTAGRTPAGAHDPFTATVNLTVNGSRHSVDLDTRTTLLDLLREHLHMTGTKKGCDHGQCGACTVIADGRRINACLSLALMHEGDEITTIEGLGSPERLLPMQAPLVLHHGYQGAYCTPGQVCSAVAVLDEIEAGIPSHVTADLMAKPEISNDEVRERMSGNICRCGAYSNIEDAIADVAGRKA